MNAHAKILREHPIFSTLSPRVLGRLTENASIVNLPKGACVFEAGAPAEAIFVVLSGRCQALTLLADGTEQMLHIYAPGDIMGERALLSRDRYSETVRVITDSSLLRLDGQDIWRMLEKAPRVTSSLLDRLHAYRRKLGDEARRQHAGIGRVTALTSVCPKAEGIALGENLATALRSTTGRSVLHVGVCVTSPDGCVWDWSAGHPRIGEAFHFMSDLRESHGGVQSLSLCTRNAADEAVNVAPLIGHLARHFHYVVVSIEPEVDHRLLIAFHRQSDLSFILFSQREESLYRAHQLIESLQEEGAGDLSHIRPLLHLDNGARFENPWELEARLGAPVHLCLRDCGATGEGQRGFYLHNPRHPASQRLRTLAREIGRCRVGIALSCGGAKGLAHVGVLEVLEENDIEVDVIAGASMGAYVGTLKAFGLTGPELRELALQMEGRFGLLKIVDPAIPPRRGFIKGAKSRRLLERTIGDAHFCDLTLLLKVVLTDLETLERVVCDHGQISPRVQASMAMPGIVLPVVLENRIYVDGGVADPLPVDVLIEMGVERIIAVNTIPNPEEMAYHAQVGRELAALPRKQQKLIPSIKHHLNYFEEGNILDIWMRSMHGIQTRVAEGACRQADVVLRPVAPGAKWHDFPNASHYLDLGRAAAEAQLGALQELVHRPEAKPESELILQET